MKKVFVVFLSGIVLLLFGCNHVNVSPGKNESAIRVFGTSQNDFLESVVLDDDGSIYMVTNQRKVDNNLDSMFLYKLDADEKLAWVKPFYLGKGTVCYNMVKLGNGLLMTLSINGSQQPLFLKTDKMGTEIWRKDAVLNYGGFKQGLDGKLLLYGADPVSNYPAVMATDSELNSVWNHTYHTKYSFFTDGLLLKDGGALVTGFLQGPISGQQSLKIMKTNSHGKLQWEDSLTSAPFVNYKTSVTGLGLIETNDEHIITLAGVVAPSGYYKMFGVKYDKSGKNREIVDLETEMSLNLGTQVSNTSFVNTVDNGFIIIGVSTYFSVTGYFNIFMSKYDAGMHKLWTKNIGNHNNLFSAIAQPLPQNGGFVIGTTTESLGAGKNFDDIMLISTDMEGNLIHKK